MTEHLEMVALEKDQKSLSGKVEQSDRIVVTYYTDPLCCWSWAFESHWRRFCDEYHERIERRYVMGGMIADWKSFRDPINDISSPAHMGPVWMHAAAVTNVPINFLIWHKDPPASSYPASIAVRNAFLQSQHAGELYLHAVRRAVMTEQRNIARTEVLMEIVQEVSDSNPGMVSVEAFRDPFNEAAAREAFRADLQKVAFHKIGRFPTLTFVKGNGEGLIMTGLRPFEKLKECLDYIV
ncbi:DsbA family protein [Fulvivirgaceae bacterium PWU5]|uniref:DsbA family protein n=1 Tax=Dawidia cretensis TaxID=2782350 RepID=A0AAP2DUV5_9BACT|nr:DsbA family protein [Dawidia cretensis]MBT1707873.1 DsbA family protein [Dawidia cretensis]